MSKVPERSKVKMGREKGAVIEDQNTIGCPGETEM
jgi:hypothetical protein